MSFLDDLKTDFGNFLDAHAPEIQSALELADKVATSPVATAALAAVHVPAEVQTVVADFIAKLDAEYEKVLPAPVDNPDPSA